MPYYKANGYPFYCNLPRPEAVEITKEEHDKLVKEINDKFEADRIAVQEAAKPVLEYEAKIQAKMREIAIKEIENEG